MDESLTPTTAGEESKTDTEQRTSDRQRLTCPECGGAVRTEASQGERACADCGLVLTENELDRGPEWRSFSDEDDDRSRVGAPATELLHDRGLSTTIDWQDRDAAGQQLSARKRERIQRLRTWDERYRTKSSDEKNLKQALGEIQRMASALGLPKACQETAAVIYRRAVDEHLLPGRSIEAVATASLYAAARQLDMPRTLGTVESVSRVDKLSIQRAYRYLSQELGLAIEPADPGHYLRRYASELEVSDEAERLGRDLLETAKREGLQSGRSPDGLAAAAIYAASHLANEKLTQADVSETADVSTLTIRQRYQEMLEVYADDRR